MNAKNLLVSLVAIASIVLLVAPAVSAQELASDISVKVDDQSTMLGSSDSDVAIIAGQKLLVEVWFTSAVDANDVRLRAEIEGEKVDVSQRTASFDVEAGKSYKKTLVLNVPYELRDEVSDDIDLDIKIWNSDYETEETAVLRVQRESYNANILSVSTVQSVDAGQTFPIDVVIKNRGYNDLDDLYVTVAVPALGLERSGYFGDIVSVEDDCDSDDDDCDDTVYGRLYMSVPYEASAGVYSVEVEVTNDDTTSSVVTEIAVNNDFSSNVIATTTSKTFAAGEEADYSLLLVNPTNKLKVYRVVTESSPDLSTRVMESLVAVPAGSSKTVSVSASAAQEGQYQFVVSVFSGESLESATTLSANVEGSANPVSANPVVVMTVILAIIFVVLLIVLIVLLGKKPEKSEDYGESYY